MPRATVQMVRLILKTMVRLYAYVFLQKRTIREYFATNIRVTTSGDFSTNVLKYVISEIGVDCIMFSAD